MRIEAGVDAAGDTARLGSPPARRLLKWLRGFGPSQQVGVGGTGSYGSALARYLSEQGVVVLEVGRPNRQVPSRHGMNDVVDGCARPAIDVPYR